MALGKCINYTGMLHLYYYEGCIISWHWWTQIPSFHGRLTFVVDFTEKRSNSGKRISNFWSGYVTLFHFKPSGLWSKKSVVGEQFPLSRYFYLDFDYPDFIVIVWWYRVGEIDSISFIVQFWYNKLSSWQRRQAEPDLSWPYLTRPVTFAFWQPFEGDDHISHLFCQGSSLTSRVVYNQVEHWFL